MTRDCGQHRDDQRLRTAQMTADLDQRGGGERVPEFDRYPLLLPQLFFDLTCSSIQPRAVFPASVIALGLFLYPAASCLPGFCSVSDSRVPSAHAQEAVRFVNGKAVPGTHDRSQKPPD
ncbi:unnamed protein product, partial [Staurois parvus]